jgi:filamentous hemagglutinin family protein
MKIRSLIALALATCIAHGNAWAIPDGGLVVRGSAIFDPRGSVLTITNTPGTIINWPGFSIGAGEVARFVQQDSSSAVLNRITGQDPSQILGALQSNGRVFLVNPNGIVFGAGAKVDVNGLVASTLDIGNDNFAAGRNVFDAANGRAGTIRNDGTITTPTGGRVYLIAPSIENNGLISSPRGEVMLAAGHHVELVDSGSPALQVVVSAPADRAVNLGRIIAEGGSIGIYGALVNQRGLVSADSAVRGEDGRIVFKASGETLLDAGSVTSARGVDHGGNIQVLGDHVGLTGDALVDASGQHGGGTVLVGGDFHGANPDVANASATYVGAQATIRADAIESGDGGRVAVWSDGATRAYGHISARGGEQSGDGGFAEVSGRGYLDYGARTDLLAPHGTAGTLLLDPNDITIQNGPVSGSNVPSTSPPVTYSGGSGSSIITVADLQASLALGSVTISTAGGSGGSGTITVAAPVAWNGTLRLDAANGIAINGALSSPADGFLYLTSGGTITQTAPIGVTYLIINSLGDVLLTSAANMVSNLAAHVGDASHLNHNFRFVNGGSLSVFNFGGVNGISIDVSGGYSSGAPDGVISLTAASGFITQTSGSLLSAKAVYAQADSVTLTEANAVGTVAGLSNSITGFAFSSAGNLDAGTVDGTTGIQAPGGSASLTAAGSLTGTVAAANILASAGNGISLTTQASTISASNSGGSAPISIVNTGALSMGNLAQLGTGAITVDNTGALDIAPNSVVSTTSGDISLTAHSPLTVNGVVTSTSGAITLSAGPSGSATDVLTINGAIAPTFAPGVAVSTSGLITLRAGDAINVTGAITAPVTQQPFLNTPPPPTLAECIANPALAGCSAVLPTLAQCTATPTLLGCSVVLPTLAQCVSNPTLAGCSAVLPTLAQCTATPTLPGCSVVLPTLAQCVADPTLAGCGAVLPTLAQCIATPTLTGCSAVLPTLAQCTATPTLAGCGVVLPLLTQCIANPTLAGCSAVLPTVAQCTATPTLLGCSVVLPLLTQCIANPTLPGCSAVLPTLAQCTATPTLAGCSAVLPTLNQCAAVPTLAGCRVVLPSLTQCQLTPLAIGCNIVLPSLAACTVTPALPGCSVVLPYLAQCIANPTLAGCSAVMPTLAQCVAAPALAGCGAVLPSLSACIANPATPGCSAILPTLGTCIATPAAAGCGAVLPTIASCVANPAGAACSVVLPTISQCIATPTAAGCSVVLPTLATCIRTPTLQGCSVVLPTLPACASNPTTAGCVVVLPPTQTQSNTPIAQVVNTTINIINTSVVTVATMASSVKDAGKDDKSSTVKADDKKDVATSDKMGAKNDDAAKKMYCN